MTVSDESVSYLVVHLWWIDRHGCDGRCWNVVFKRSWRAARTQVRPTARHVVAIAHGWMVRLVGTVPCNYMYYDVVVWRITAGSSFVDAAVLTDCSVVGHLWPTVQAGRWSGRGRAVRLEWSRGALRAAVNRRSIDSRVIFRARQSVSGLVAFLLSYYGRPGADWLTGWLLSFLPWHL